MHLMYNIGFLLAGLVFLLLILGHFLFQRQLDLGYTRSFLLFLVTGIANILMDLLCTVLISLDRPALAELTEGCLTLLYLLQVLVPYTMFYHVVVLLGEPAPRFARRAWCMAGPPALMGLLILLNHWTGYLFQLDGDGSYSRGVLYPVMYLFAGAYILVILALIIRYRARLGRQKVVALGEVLFFGSICTIIQAIHHDFLVAGFGIALGISVLFFTLNNPYFYIDGLTGVYDIRYFHRRADSLFRHQTKFHLLAVDLRQLRQVNLAHGVDQGNRLLEQVARELMGPHRQNLVFRVSGKRFLVIVPSAAAYEALRERLRRFFSSPLVLQGEAVSPAAALVGILEANVLGDGDTLLAYVGYLISLAPESPGTVMVQSDEKALRGFRYLQEIRGFLKTALEQDLFQVYYQPVYSISRGSYVSLEALSRLHHPALGPVSPDVFIPLAEKHGQIAAIGLLQMRRICAFLTDHPELRRTVQNVKINLSPAELTESGHVSRLLELIYRSGLPPALFQFEITETAATEYSETVHRIAGELSLAGVGLCMDDFGSGFANLNTVLKFPFSVVKLDKSLLDGICTKPRNASFYQSIVAALENLGFSIIAEGVETKGELDLVSRWGVDLIQGFYFSRPLSEDALLETLGIRPEPREALSGTGARKDFRPECTAMP